MATGSVSSSGGSVTVMMTAVMGPMRSSVRLRPASRAPTSRVMKVTASPLDGAVTATATVPMEVMKW